MKVGNWLILKAADFPVWKLAHKLARSLSQDDIEALLAKEKHIHKNPKKKKVSHRTLLL